MKPQSDIAQVLLVRTDKSIILQRHDEKRAIGKPSQVSMFGTSVGPNEEPLDAALRAIHEATNLPLRVEDLQLYRRTKAIKSEDRVVHIFVATNISEHGLEIYKGQGYAVIHDAQELAAANATAIARQVVDDYFAGFRSFMFQADMPDEKLAELLDSYYSEIVRDKSPSSFTKPVVLGCTGLVAAGKSTVTLPLAEAIDAVRVSNDYIREKFFRAGYNFKQLRPFVQQLLKRLIEERLDVFLDFNVSTNIPILEDFLAHDYQIFIVYANPPEAFIKKKILSGNMKHELTFFPKDEFVYQSMLAWKDEHLTNVGKLREKFGIWAEVDTSRDDLQTYIPRLVNRFKHDLQFKGKAVESKN